LPSLTFLIALSKRSLLARERMRYSVSSISASSSALGGNLRTTGPAGIS
jgi:hypothetical protein